MVATSRLEDGLDDIRRAPTDDGTLELIARRPDVDQREILPVGELDVVEGLVGDSWSRRSSTSTPDGSPHPEAQLNIMSSRVAALLAGPDHERWALAGDQLYVDFDLSRDALPAGTRLSIGDAVVEITAKPHRGCAKFADRFGAEALRFVNTGLGIPLNLRGRNARVVVGGTVATGDRITRPS